jgi:hypothetical protein
MCFNTKERLFIKGVIIAPYWTKIRLKKTYLVLILVKNTGLKQSKKFAHVVLLM